ncbi:MAG: hypothetical protein ACE5GS_08675 [Kiloniellaceae bacterium]
MSATAELGKDLDAVGAVLLRARAELDAGHAIDLSPLEERVNGLCARLKTLPADEGSALRPRVLALIDDFGHLARTIEARLEELRQDLGGAAGRVKALNAYGKTSRSPGSSRKE